MKKKLITLLIGLAAILLLPAAASASNYGFEQGDYVELNGYRFIVLDPETDYLFANFYLENRAFDPDRTRIYDPNDQNNVAYYLNNSFLENLGDLSNYVKDYSWGIGNEKNEKSVTVNTKIGMLSYSEYRSNASYYTSRGLIPRATNTFWTLTPHYTNIFDMWSVIVGGAISDRGPTSPAGVRPSLYLEPDLYKSGLGTPQSPYVLSAVPEIILSEIKELSLLKTTTSEITLKWINPSETNFSHINLYQDGSLINSNFISETYTFTGLSPSREYTFTITAVDINGKETEGISIVVSTDDVPLVPEIQNLNATTKHDRVNLSWNNPQSEFFNHVRIYRKLDEEELKPTTFNFFQPLIVSASENEDFNPMFETNGTYWNDLTVEPATTYSYKLTTVNIADAESEGTTIQVTTEGEPLPEIGGGGYEEQENGDYLYTWTSPTSGQVKVMIDGNEYRVVDAATKQILIPAADMKYDIFNRPKVTLIPISEDGTEGAPSKPPNQNGGGGTDIGGAELPFTVRDMVTAGLTLLGLVAGFVLLGLAFRFVPKFISTIFTSFRSGQGDEASRTTEREPRQRRSV